MDVNHLLTQLNRLQGCYNLLISRYAPFKRGERVILNQAPEPQYFEHLKPDTYRELLLEILQEGTMGVVQDVQAYPHGFKIGTQIDNYTNHVVYLPESILLTCS